MQIDVGATARTERPKLVDARLPTNRTGRRCGGTAAFTINHAPNISARNVARKVGQAYGGLSQLKWIGNPSPASNAVVS
jgi:hypothetical protein